MATNGMPSPAGPPNERNLVSNPQSTCYLFTKYFAGCGGITTRRVCRDARNIWAENEWVHPHAACKETCRFLEYHMFDEGMCPRCNPRTRSLCDCCEVDHQNVAHTFPPDQLKAMIERWSYEGLIRRMAQIEHTRATSGYFALQPDDQTMLEMHHQNFDHNLFLANQARGNDLTPNEIQWRVNAMHQLSEFFGYVDIRPHDCRLRLHPTRDPEEQCGICRLHLWVPSARRLPCGHIFHYMCIMQIVHDMWPGHGMPSFTLMCPYCQKAYALVTMPLWPDDVSKQSWIEDANAALTLSTQLQLTGAIILKPLGPNNLVLR
jgi:hypothetical protein